MIEKRVSTIQTDNNFADKMILTGRAIVFDTPTRIKTEKGSYIEIIKRSALIGAAMDDVKLFYNHDVNTIPLARTPKTMQLSIENEGLQFRAELPDTEAGRGMYEAVKRGDLTGMSFAFSIPDGGDEWQDCKRTIKKIEKLYECSIVAFPAYAETSVEARGKRESTKTACKNSTQQNFEKEPDLNEI